MQAKGLTTNLLLQRFEINRDVRQFGHNGGFTKGLSSKTEDAPAADLTLIASGRQ